MVTVKGDHIAIDMDTHKPVITEIVCDSLEVAQKKLGQAAFYRGTSYKIIGVNQAQLFLDEHLEDRSYYWTWGGKDYLDTAQGNQMKPWLRRLLGLPELPSEFYIFYIEEKH